ncbi:hypothetical protein [Ruegeria arenilitoris]|uniref:hypothetical protein n=1 Tax=Ruegeria arenilitoris TaxID=1173585 RepID=UPI0014801F72|nr:hypothetical protein [Ruegeria arenilitoris]
MRNLYLHLASFFAFFAQASNAEESWILTSSFINNSEVGALSSSLSLRNETVDESTGTITMNGTIADMSGSVTPVSVSVTSFEAKDNFSAEGGQIETVAGPAEIRRIANYVSMPEPKITTSVYSVVGLETSDVGFITVQDDPNPLIILGLTGGAYMLICGGLEIYRAKQACSENRSLDIGIEYKDFKFGCYIECKDPDNN